MIRRAPFALGIVMLVAGLVACGGDDSQSTSARDTTTTAVADDTTTTAEAPPPSPTTAVIPFTTDPNGIGPAVSPEGSRLAEPEAGTPARTGDPENGCEALAQPGYTAEACATAVALTALVERSSTTGELLAWVFRNEGDALTPVLVAFASADELTGISLATADLDDDGIDDFVFGFRTTGTAQFLDVDIVGQDATVTAHRSQLYRGRATVTRGQLDTWTAILAADDPNCCPSSFQHEVVQYVSGEYHLVASEAVSPDEVPEGDL